MLPDLRTDSAEAAKTAIVSIGQVFFCSLLHPFIPTSLPSLFSFVIPQLLCTGVHRRARGLDDLPFGPLLKASKRFQL